MEKGKVPSFILGAILGLLLVSALCLIMYGVNPKPEADTNTDTSRYIFEKVDDYDNVVKSGRWIDDAGEVYRDVKTDIIYVRIDSSFSGLTMLYDTDGKPMTYERYKELYK